MNPNPAEFFFTPCATESEHDCIEESISAYCKENQLTLVYYRQCKNEHIPLYRECKVQGDKQAIRKFKAWCIAQELISEDTPQNIHKP